MKFNYTAARNLMRRELLAALKAHKSKLTKIAKAERCSYRDTSAVNGVAFDLLPWEDCVYLSFRLETDEANRYSPADWKYYRLICEDFFPKVLRLTSDFYKTNESKSGHDAKHVIFLAAADALLSPPVAKLLRSCGIDAPIVGNKIPYTGFNYLVLDVDQVLKANYCEILVANRVAKRLVGRIPQ